MFYRCRTRWNTGILNFILTERRTGEMEGSTSGWTLAGEETGDCLGRFSSRGQYTLLLGILSQLPAAYPRQLATQGHVPSANVTCLDSRHVKVLSMKKISRVPCFHSRKIKTEETHLPKDPSCDEACWWGGQVGFHSNSSNKVEY